MAEKVTEEQIQVKLQELASESQEAVNTLYPQRVHAYTAFHDMVDNLTSASLKRVLKYGLGYPLVPTMDPDNLTKMERQLFDLFIEVKDIDVQLAFAALFVPKPEKKEESND